MKMIVHDLKTPLTSVLASLEMALDGDFGALSVDARRALGDAELKAKDLLTLIEDLLEVARIEEAAIHLDLAPLAPAAFLADVVEEWEVRCRQEGARVSLESAGDVPTVRADAGLLRRVFANLMQNALTHAPPGVCITLSAHPAPDGGVLFTVADDGPGIPPEYHELIFRKFEVVRHAALPRARGSGLGLTFCKLAVEAHGGRIWVQSAPGQGSQFHIVLPAEPETSAPATPAS